VGIRQELREQHLLHAQLLLVQEQERKQIAADVHDGVLQDISALLLQIERGKRTLAAGNNDVTQIVFAELREDLKQVSATLRGLTRDLYPAILTDCGLPTALRSLVRQAGEVPPLDIQIDSTLDERFDPALEIAAFRVAQEALANVRKHAQATQVLIRLDHYADQVHLEVQDNGIGFEVEPAQRQARRTGHIGLLSMIDRVEGLGGQVAIVSAPGRGTIVRCRIPFQAAAGPNPRPTPPSSRPRISVSA
jgi:signal transduction histidine kinase